MIVLAARYYAKPGSGDEVAEGLREMTPLSRAEDGCELYFANRSTEDPDVFLLYEHYRDEAALAAHRETPHFERIVEGRIMPLVDRRERELYALVSD